MRVGHTHPLVSEVDSGSNLPFSCGDNYHALGEGQDEVKLGREKIRGVDQWAGGKKGVIGRETGTYGSSGRLPAARGRVKEMGAVHGRCGGGVGAAKHRAGQGGPPRLRIRHSTTTARAAVGYRWLVFTLETGSSRPRLGAIARLGMKSWELQVAHSAMLS
jgi:hypothetical protein